MRSTSKDCADASDELARVEGFGDVVVCADFKPEDPVDVFAASSKDQNRDWRFHAETLEYVESSYSRQHEIEDDEGVLC